MTQKTTSAETGLETLVGDLDFIYLPSSEVEKDLEFYTRILRGRPFFSIAEMGTRVAALKLGQGPLLLLAGHLSGSTPILIYRVDDFESTVKILEEGGIKGTRLEIPQGPCFSFRARGGQRFAVYELVRPGVANSFAGRFNKQR